jgi:hypothetical protein
MIIQYDRTIFLTWLCLQQFMKEKTLLKIVEILSHFDYLETLSTNFKAIFGKGG